MVSETEIVVYAAIAAALFFDFVNGFHDSANAIATVVGTKVLRPLQAVGMAAIANVAGPFILCTTVAKTVGKNIIQPEFSTVVAILSGLIGAITWYLGLPSSSSHALVGGLIGAGLVAGGIKALVSIRIEKTVIFMVASPLLGLVVAFGFTICLMYFLGQSKLAKVNKIFGKLQIASSAFFSLTHGANDGQKTMGIITALLLAGQLLPTKSFIGPIPIILVAALAIWFRDILWGMENCKYYGV